MPDLYSKTFDIIICGAGPAGSTCALALSESGLRVAVLEKQDFPRDKVCGGAIGAYVPKILNTINPNYKDALKSFDEKIMINTCRIIAPNEKTIDFNYNETGFISKRLHWDNFLYKLASAEENITYFFKQTVTDVNINDEKGEVTITTNDNLYKAKMVIGCDGNSSLIRKKLNSYKPNANHYATAIRGYYRNVSGIPDKTYELHFIKDLKIGYFWIFPLGENIANVGIGGSSSEIKKYKMNLPETMKNIINNVPYIKERFENAELLGEIKGCALPLCSQKLSISGNRFMLCGDAASLINPLTGEGIGQAMSSGRYAGWHAKKCFEQNNFSKTFMKLYDKMVYDKLWNESRKSRYIKHLLKNREWLFNTFCNIASNNKFIQRTIQKIID